MSADRNACRHPHVSRDVHLEAPRGDVRLPAQDNEDSAQRAAASCKTGVHAGTSPHHRSEERRECRPTRDPPVRRYRYEAHAIAHAIRRELAHCASR
jgi:hypothetical protein